MQLGECTREKEILIHIRWLNLFDVCISYIGTNRYLEVMHSWSRLSKVGASLVRSKYSLDLFIGDIFLFDI